VTDSPAHRTTLPPCPSWCTEEHHQAANPVGLADFSNPGGLGASAKEASSVRRVCHRHQIGHGTTAVLIYQVVDVGTDGSVLHQLPPDLSWNHAESATPGAATQLAANLRAATDLLGSVTARCHCVRPRPRRP
jgi:hypothetical protein